MALFMQGDRSAGKARAGGCDSLGLWRLILAPKAYTLALRRHLRAYSALCCLALFPDRGIVYKLSYHVRVEPPGLCLSLWAEGAAQQPCSKISTFVRNDHRHRRLNGAAGCMLVHAHTVSI